MFPLNTNESNERTNEQTNEIAKERIKLATRYWNAFSLWDGPAMRGQQFYFGECVCAPNTHKLLWERPAKRKIYYVRDTFYGIIKSRPFTVPLAMFSVFFFCRHRRRSCRRLYFVSIFCV